MTFAATANAVIHAGGVPVFADCKIDTMNIDVKDIERKITKKTKAIIPVHFAGRPCEMDKIILIAKKFNLKVIEDCAQSPGGQYKNKNLGTIGNCGVFSFQESKNIMTGEGGLIVTNNEKISTKCRLIRNHGESIVKDNIATRNGIEGFIFKGGSKQVIPQFSNASGNANSKFIRIRLKYLGGTRAWVAPGMPFLGVYEHRTRLTGCQN